MANKLHVKTGDQVIVVSGKNGVESGTRRAWKICEKYHLPRMVFVTEMDIDDASFRQVVEDLQELYGKKIAPFHLPIRENVEQVTTFKSKKSKLLNVIRYDTLYEYLGITAPNNTALRDKKRDIRSKVRTILNTWTRVGFIKGYEEQGERNAIAKVQILLS